MTDDEPTDETTGTPSPPNPEPLVEDESPFPLPPLDIAERSGRLEDTETRGE
jgi:hypothetical protein